jgi:SAM-dependent methyltransferase
MVAALLTLRAVEVARDGGMTVRDASAYNVLLDDGRPILIDSLSFESAVEDRAWQPYRQFCEHFLAPLALMAKVDVRLGRLLREHIDGIPLDLTARLLPRRTRFSFGLGPHVHLHARAQRQHADDGAPSDGKAGGTLSAKRRATLIESLRTTIEGLRWEPSGTEWADYADNTSYDDAATAAKAEAVRAALEGIGGRSAWDLGANTGRYSRIAAEAGYSVVALDLDPAAVERAYLAIRETDGDILPLLADLTDPSPALGWGGVERRSLFERADADVALALALVHHLAIGANVPLPMVSDVFASIAPHAVVEFVPKEDPMVRKLLASRQDIFPDYHLDGLRDAFAARWDLVRETAIEGSQRTLLHFERRGD